MNKRQLTQISLLSLGLYFSTALSSDTSTSVWTTKELAVQAKKTSNKQQALNNNQSQSALLQSQSLPASDNNHNLNNIRKNLVENTNLIHKTIKQDDYNIKFIVIITCIITLGFTLFAIVPRLTRKQKKTKTPYKQKSVLDNTGIGVISISPNFIVESNKNKTIQDLFHRSNFDQASILDLLASIADHATCKKTRQFLDLAFDSKTSEQHINNGNPLKYFTVYKRDKHNNLTPRYMQSDFKRTFDNKEVSKLLMIIQDRTNNIKSQTPNQEQNRGKVPAQYFKETTPKSDKRVIRIFLEDGVMMVKELESLIRKNETSQSSARENLQYISRINQKLCGEAKLINYDPLLSLTKNFELQIAQLKQKSPLRKSDFHGLIPHVNAIKKAFKSLSQEVSPNAPSKKSVRQLSI